MKKLVFIVTLFLGLSFTYGQNSQTVTVTKEMVCEGAATSVVYSLAPTIEYKMPKSVIDEIVNANFKEVIHPSTDKAYNLLVSGKGKKEVIAILYADYMKLDDEIVMKGLLKDDGLGE